MRRTIAVSSLVAGVVFGLGLALSGMTDPHRVRAFLDIAGAWDPTLMFVMGGAILAHAPIAWWMRRRGTAAFAPLSLPVQKRIDGRLLGGAALFGVGWGLSGYCPGPALESLVSPTAGTVLFLVAMAVGSRLGGVAKVSHLEALTARADSR